MPGLMAAQGCSSGQGEAWGSDPSELHHPTNQFPSFPSSAQTVDPWDTQRSREAVSSKRIPS